MKRLILTVGIALFVLAALHLSVTTLEAQYSSANYNEIGGARTVIGGDIDIIDGGEINIEDGGDLYFEPTDTTPTAAIGWVYFDLSETALTYHNGSAWVSLTGTTTLPDNQLRRAVVAIADTDMDQLAATPIELVPTPGAAAYLEFVSAVFALDWGATAWTEPSAPDDLVIRYTNGSGALVSELLDATGFATATADTITHLSPASDIIAGTTAKVAVLASASVNQALVLHNTGSEWTNSGDSQVVVIVYYRIHTTTELGL